MRKLFFILCLSAMVTSCVSKKKYTDLEYQLQQTQRENQACHTKMTAIETKVEEYNQKIQQLRALSNSQMTSVDDVVVMSENTKKEMRKTLQNVNPQELSSAKTVLDSMNLAIKYNLSKGLDSDLGDDLNVNIEETVVVINISDRFLFKSADYHIGKEGIDILGKLAKVINEQPGLEVLVEGHTDSQSIKTSMFRNNWDLSVKRAASIVEILQDQFNVDPSRLIAAGRSSYKPVASNDTKEGRAKNRRTRIVILPELEKLFALLAP